MYYLVNLLLQIAKSLLLKIFCRQLLAPIAFFLGVLVLFPVFGETPKAELPDKWKYNILEPVPAEYMRPMSTDRPDQTESPYTVDAGHYQIEASFFDYTTDTNDSEKFDQWNIAPVNLKVGLWNNVDLQLYLDNYIWQSTNDKTENVTIDNEGFGDVTTRLKINLWGNDSGTTALAIMPFVKIPTNSGDVGNQHVEGGVIVPLAIELPSGWSMGVMTEFDVLRNINNNDNHHVEYVNSITFGRNIVGKLAGYIEFFSRVSSEQTDAWQGTVDGGLTYELTDNLRLDAGCNFGVIESANDFNPFMGISARF